MGQSSKVDNLRNRPQNLKILVPHDVNSDDEFDNEDTGVNFDKITQLPTPLINHGKFNGFEKSKFINHDEFDDKIHHDRVISDYKPSFNQANVKRYVSNPNVSSLSRSSSLKSTKSSDSLDEDQKNCKYIGQVFTVHDHIFIGQSLIGKGNFSTVIKASSDFDDIAIKIISIPITSKLELNNFKSFIKRELNILYQLDHPTVISLIDYQTNLIINTQEISSSTYFTQSESQSDLTNLNYDEDLINLKQNPDQLIFLNYCRGENLYKFSINSYNYYEFSVTYWNIIKRIVCEVLVAIKYLHHLNIIHRDIKLENILLKYTFDELYEIFNHNQHIFQSSIINLTDFGLSKKLGDDKELLSTRCGSQDYISPELLMGLKYNGKLTDSWSVGVLIYCLLENRLPFDIPPLSALSNSQISPSVIKRKRANNNPAHRIAMIDWSWWKVEEMLNNPNLDPHIRVIINQLKSVVELLLIRKDKRKTITQIFDSSDFEWIKDTLPNYFYEEPLFSNYIEANPST